MSSDSRTTPLGPTGTVYAFGVGGPEPRYRLLPVIARPRVKQEHTPTVSAFGVSFHSCEVIDLTDDEPTGIKAEHIKIESLPPLPALESAGGDDESGDELDADEGDSDDADDATVTASESEADSEGDSDAELQALDADVTQFNLGLNAMDAHLSGRDTDAGATDSDSSSSSSTSKRSAPSALAVSKSKSGSNLIHINGAATNQWKKAAKHSKKRSAGGGTSSIPSQHELDQRRREIDATFILLEEEQKALELKNSRSERDEARLSEIADAFVELEDEQEHLDAIDDKYYAESGGADTTDCGEDEAMEVDEDEIARECGSSAASAWDLTSATATVEELRRAVFAQDNVWRVKLELELESSALQTSSSTDTSSEKAQQPFAHYFRTLGTIHAKYGVDMSQFVAITDSLVFPQPVSSMSDVPPSELSEVNSDAEGEYGRRATCVRAESPTKKRRVELMND